MSSNNTVKRKKIPLSDNQKKIIAFLLKRSEKKPRKRGETIKKINKKSKEQPLFNQDRKYKIQIPSSLPITFSENTIDYLKKLRDDEYVRIKFPNGFVNGGKIIAIKRDRSTKEIGAINTRIFNKDEKFPSLKIEAQHNEESLDIVMKYSNFSSGISFDSKKQGDLIYQVAQVSNKNLGEQDE